MAWRPVTDRTTRERILGRWAADKNVVLWVRSGYADFGTGPYFASAAVRPGGPEKCPGGRPQETGGASQSGRAPSDRHDYRHFETRCDLDGGRSVDVGGYVILKGSDWGYVTEAQTCDALGPLVCRHCGDTYDPDSTPPAPQESLDCPKAGYTGGGTLYEIQGCKA